MILVIGRDQPKHVRVVSYGSSITFSIIIAAEVNTIFHSIHFTSMAAAAAAYLHVRCNLSNQQLTKHTRRRISNITVTKILS